MFPDAALFKVSTHILLPPKHPQKAPPPPHLLHLLRPSIHGTLLHRNSRQAWARKRRTHRRRARRTARLPTHDPTLRPSLAVRITLLPQRQILRLDRPPALTSAHWVGVLFVARAAQSFDFPAQGRAVGGEVFFGNGRKADDASVGGDTQGVGHEGLQEGGVAFVSCGLDLGGEGGEGEDVGRVEGAGEE